MRGPTGQAAVMGDGPVPCRIMLVGEAPGWQEMKAGKGFVGRSGDVLWEFLLRTCSLTRADCFVDNLVKHMVEGQGRDEDEKITPEEIAYWEPYLLAELERVQPEYVVTLGRYSTRWFLGQQQTMEVCHGLAHRVDGPRFCLTIIPCYHPAAGLHEPSQLARTYQDFEALNAILRGSLEYERPVDQHPEPDYAVGLYPIGGPAPVVGVDTEGSIAEPWSLQWSIRPGHAGLLFATDKNGLRLFKQWLETYRPMVLFHHAVHDLRVSKSLGIDIVEMGLTFADTMVLAHITQRLPIGLKPLATRLCGMPMTNWEDTIQPYDNKVAAAYLMEVLQNEKRWPKGVGRKQGICKRARNAVRSNEKTGKPFRTGWLDIEEELRRPVEEALGPMPPLRCNDVPREVFVPYACRDADATLRVFPIINKMLGKEQMPVVQLDHGVLPMVVEMEEVGVPFDVPRLNLLSKEFGERMEVLEELVHTLTGIPDLNINSGDQVAEWCRQEWIHHQRCGLTRMTKSKKREQVNEESLALIANDHPAIPLMLQWQKLRKLKNDYTDKMPLMLSEDGRYHPDFRITAAVSGRAGEWILTIPAKTEDGRKIRHCAVAPDGWMFGGADLSQIELRVAADESHDPAMVEAFRRGEDFHTRTAARIFSVEYDGVDKLAQRYPCKELNFLVLYGGAEVTLSRKLQGKGLQQWTEEKCAALIRGWFAAYAGVGPYMAERAAEARRRGYVQDRWGRRRHLPGVLLDDRVIRSAQEREAGNFPIQAGAQGVIKRAQIRWWRKELPELRKRGVRVHPILQYHDEINVLFAPEHEEPVKASLLKVLSADQPLFSVPITGDWASGRTWGDLKEE